MKIRSFILAAVALVVVQACEQDVQTTDEPTRQPIIDVHKHTSWAGDDDTAYRTQSLGEMDENNIVVSVLHMGEPSDLSSWKAVAPDRFVAGPMMPCPERTSDQLMCFPEQDGWPDLGWLEAGLASGEIGMLGEMLFIYFGLEPADPRMDKYWALAAKYDVPVSVHINRGPPPGAPPRLEGCCPNFDSDLGNPALLRAVVEKHPDLRIYIQHAGLFGIPVLDNIDYTEETFALLRDYPNVYADMTILNALWDEEAHRAVLQQFIAEGFGDRIMFGTDNLPAAPIIARLNSFEFLTDKQRSAIFYDNAARFFRFDQGTIDKHYARQ